MSGSFLCDQQNEKKKKKMGYHFWGSFPIAAAK